MRAHRGALALGAAIALAMASPQADAGGFLRAQGTRIVDADGKPVVLRGVGLGGWMLQEGYMLELTGDGTQRSIRARIQDLVGEQATRDFYTAWLDHHTTKDDIDAMAAWGFNSVRLPMHYELYTAPVEEEKVPGQQTWREDGFRRTDQLLSWVKANGMVLILDLHAAPGGQGNDLNISDRDPAKPSLWDSAANQDKMVALWKKLAQRYRDEPAIAAYDIINEPNWGFSDPADRHGCAEKENTPLRQLLVRTTQAIREVDRNHIIAIEGNCWGNNYRGVLDDKPWDDNLVVSFHKYWNATTPDTLQDLLALSQRWQVPLWLGETGENSNEWFSATAALVEAHGIGWAAWPLKKIRYNNPLQIVANDGYSKVAAYWRGEGPRPTRGEALNALDTLARHDIAFGNNVQHPDVVDAWLRAPHSDRSVPFKDHRIGADGGRIGAADFDMGRNGVAYFDQAAVNVSGKPDTAWNPSMAYRNDGVALSVKDGVARVVDFNPGEWLKYTLSDEAGGVRSLRVIGDPGRVRIVLNGDDAGTVATGKPVQVRLLPGRNTLVIESASKGLAVDAVQLSPGGR